MHDGDVDMDDAEEDEARDEEEDEHLYYAPEKGNVVFASAWDGWAFRASDFADLTARKVHCPKFTVGCSHSSLHTNNLPCYCLSWACPAEC